MQLISFVWRVGLPFVVVAGSAVVLVSAIRFREVSAPISRSAYALFVLLWLRLVGDAALGDQRPEFERQWKGAAAVLLTLAGALYLRRRYRRRDRDIRQAGPTQQSQPEPTAVALPAAQSSLALPVTMPALGQDVVEATVTRWLKQVGDRVEAGEPLVEVSVDKVDTEIPAAASGILSEIKAPTGGTAAVGTTIAVIESAVRNPSSDR